MEMVKNKNEQDVDFVVAVELMDSELVDEIHNSMETYSAQEFFSAYEKAHEEKFGEEWELSKENPVY